MKLFSLRHTLFDRNARTGFSLIEVIVAMTIVAVLAAVSVVSYSGAVKTSRDARRKKDLVQIQAALEAYKLVNGTYPVHTACASTHTRPGCNGLDPWIPGITSTYIDVLPTDPNAKVPGYIPSSPTTYTYNYRRINATTYHLITRLENTSDPGLNGNQYGYSGTTGIYVLASPR